MPAPGFVGFAGAEGDVSIGSSTDEVGILLGDMDYTHDDPKVEFFDTYGGVIGLARKHNSMLTLNVNGEVDDVDGGVCVAVFNSAATLLNEEYFAASASTYNGIDYANAPTLLDSVSGAQPRGGARTLSLTYIRHAGMTTV